MRSKLSAALLGLLLGLSPGLPPSAAEDAEGSAAATESEATMPSAPVEYIGGHAVYGANMPRGLAPVTLGEALGAEEAAGSAGNEATMRIISGRIGQVCQAKGCWMMLTEGDLAVRVKFGDHAFFLPKDISGEALVYGRFERKQMSEAQARHMAEDAGADPDSVDGPQEEWRIHAESVLVKATS